MHPSLVKNMYLVKEHVGLFKAANEYDIYDPETGEIMLHCREPNLGTITKLLRFTDYKTMTPFDIHITTATGEPVIRVSRGISFFLSKVDVFSHANNRVGGFKQKLFSIGGAFSVLDDMDVPLCELKGKWTGWNFSFHAAGMELARVTKKWNGLGKELFTSADTYMLEIDEAVEAENPVRELILGAVMCIDMVLKER